MMDPAASHTLFEWMIATARQHQAWAGLIIFAVAMAESLVIVGVVVPGAIMMLGVGALIALGALDLWSSLAWAVAGAVVGDGLSFWLGHHYRDGLRKLWPFSRFTHMMQQGEAFFRRHGGKSIVFGRFVGPVRAIIPTVAGMMGMTPQRFLVVNVLSAIAWAPAYILPGMVFGASLELASEVALRLVIVVLLLVAVLLVTRWLVRRLYGFLQPRAGAMISWALRWSRTHPILGEISAALVDPRHPESPALLVLAILLIAAGLSFFGIVSHLLGYSGNAGFDATVYHLMQDLRTPWADSLMVVITMLGDAAVYIPFAAIVLLWLLWRRDIAAAGHWLAAVGFGMVLTRVLKVALEVPRPTELYTEASSFAFPSAHATMSTVVFGFLAVMVARELTPPRRSIPYLVAGLLIISISLSRLYLGAHWFSDVAGGITLGLAWIALLGIAYRQHRSPPLPVVPLMITILVGMTVPAAIHIGSQYSHELQRYAPRFPVRTLPAELWWQQGWKQLPAYRQDLSGEHEQPLNLQWMGSLAQLRTSLEKQGWRKPIAFHPSSFLQWLSPRVKLEDLPVLPQVNNGRHEALVLTHPTATPAHQWVLRLWPSDVEIVDHRKQRLWIGYVSEQRLARPLYIVAYPSTGTNFNEPLQFLKAQLNDFAWREVQRLVNHGPEDLQWGGGTLLVRNARPPPGASGRRGNRGVITTLPAPAAFQTSARAASGVRSFPIGIAWWPY